MKTKILFSTFFLLSEITFAQFFPKKVESDLRLGSIARKTILTKEALNFLSEERASTCVFNVLTDTSAFFAPLRLAKYEKYFQAASEKTGLSADLLKAIAFVESGGRPKIRSNAGAVGIMQLMPACANFCGLSSRERTNPEKNIQAGAKYLRYLCKLFDNRSDLAIASYHMGEGNMNRNIELALKEFYGIDTTVNGKNSSAIVEKFDLSYALMYFGAESNGALHKRLVNLKDWSMDYCFRVLGAQKALVLDSAGFDGACRQIVRGQEKTYRFFTWCQESVFEEDEIIILPFSTSKLYTFLNWPEEAPEDELIGETVFHLSREAAGAALTIGALYRELLKQNGIAFSPISIDQAFEMPKQCETFAFVMSPPDSKDAKFFFDFVLKRLGAFGFISYKGDEGSYTIVASPDKEKMEVLEAIYLETKEYQNW